jgi:hypothetical protein
MARKSKYKPRVTVALKNRTLGAHATFPMKMSRAIVEASIPRGWRPDWDSLLTYDFNGHEIGAVLLRKR